MLVVVELIFCLLSETQTFVGFCRDEMLRSPYDEELLSTGEACVQLVNAGVVGVGLCKRRMQLTHERESAR